MSGVLNWMQNSFAPKMNKINHNVWIVTLKDSINQVMPLIFLGSIFSLLTLPGSFFQWSWWPAFSVLNGWTMGVISVMVAFLVPFNYMEKVRMRKSRIIAGMSGLILFFIIINTQLQADQAIGFNHSAFGAGGMFVAIIAGIVSALIMKTYGKFSFFSEDSALPDFIRSWFDQMLPVATVVILGWMIVDLLNFDLFTFILSIFRPLEKFTETYWGFLLIYVITILLYSMGISAWVLAPITTPLKLAAIEANAQQGALNIFTHSFSYAYLTIGGVGCTLGLVLLFMFSKSKKLKALGNATIVPSIFNINEPVVFGAIVWNPILMVGFVLNSIISFTLAYAFTKVISFATIPNYLFQLWYCPFPISAWLATNGSIASVILVLIIFAATTAVWYPFFKVYEKQCLNEESKESKNNKNI